MFGTSDELDRLLMPPPNRFYDGGNPDRDTIHQQAGFVQLSLPSPPEEMTFKGGEGDHESNQPVVPPMENNNGKFTDRAYLVMGSDDENNDDSALACKRKATREIAVEKSRFDDIIGHGAAKLRIEEILLTMALPTDVAQKVLTGVRAMPTSILLYGPPGCGKVSSTIVRHTGVIEFINLILL
jgi:hypothetical protein